jgi:hypothetical protein
MLTARLPTVEPRIRRMLGLDARACLVAKRGVPRQNVERQLQHDRGRIVAASRARSPTDAIAVFDEFGFREHLTPQRSNGLRAMVERIRTDARGTLAAAS